MLKKFRYMGKEIDPSLLMTKTEFLRRMNTKGPTDETLDEIRKGYEERFGMEMAWRFPAMDDPHNTAVIIPLQEGFLWLPLDPLFYGKQVFYKLKDVEMLDARSFDALLQDFKPYAKELTLALNEMGAAMEDVERPQESVRLTLPDGQILRAIVSKVPDYPSMNIQLEGPGPDALTENLCFAEFNTERPAGHQLCICAYTSGEDEPAYYKSYSPCEKDKK